MQDDATCAARPDDLVRTVATIRRIDGQCPQAVSIIQDCPTHDQGVSGAGARSAAILDGPTSLAEPHGHVQIRG